MFSIYFHPLSDIRWVFYVLFFLWFQDKEVMCEHPLSDIGIAGEAVQPLQNMFHTFLQTVSDSMMYLPPGSSLQVCDF